MRIALDIDDTITRHPAFFQLLSSAFKAAGHEVFIISYRADADDTAAELAEYGIEYDELILATDDAFCGQTFYGWKAEVCREKKIDVFFEDMPGVINELDSSTLACMVVDPSLGRVDYQSDE